jgi:GDP-4-dehydro-6-deoxy-D-mannose reductase
VRILITGATGFVGGHLIEHLRAEGGHDLVGISRHPANTSTHGIRFVTAELLDRPVVETVLRDVRPNWVFHLAGYASPGRSYREPDACWADNLAATRSLYDAVGNTGLQPRILYVSSGLVYGDPAGPDDVFSETTQLRPTSPYAASKAAADLLSFQVTIKPGLDVIRVRPFNQVGPGQTPDYAVANFARQVVAIERGEQQPVIETGDLSARRDLTDVRDMVAGYRSLIEQGARGDVYNAGSGTARRIGETLTRLVELSGVRVEIRQLVDPTRAVETGVARADSAKLRAVTGWAPRYSLDQTLKDVLTYWRAVAARPNT